MRFQASVTFLLFYPTGACGLSLVLFRFHSASLADRLQITIHNLGWGESASGLRR